MGVYIKNWSLADWKELLMWAKIGANNAMIGEFSEVEEVPQHGRLIDADALTKMCQEMQSIEWNSKASPYSWAYAYESFEGDIDNAPTIIPAEEGET